LIRAAILARYCISSPFPGGSYAERFIYPVHSGEWLGLPGRFALTRHGTRDRWRGGTAMGFARKETHACPGLIWHIPAVVTQWDRCLRVSLYWKFNTLLYRMSRRVVSPVPPCAGCRLRGVADSSTARISSAILQCASYMLLRHERARCCVDFASCITDLLP